MYGIGILKGLSVTFKHLITTFVDDISWVGKRGSLETFQIKQGLSGRGMYTVQYPEEKIAVPERFRYIPFLVTYNQDDPEYPGKDWCTSCGICAKVCPPQCIWITRGTDPVTGRPKAEPENFHIDIDICMNCGYCAEYCPFDAIKMDHDYELATYDRTGVHIRDHAHLTRELRYWEQIAPTTAAEEQAARGGYDHSDVQKSRKKANLPATRQGPTSDKPVVAAAPVAAAAVSATVAAPVTAATATAPAASAAPATVLNAEGKPVVVRRRNAGATTGSTPAAATPATAPAAESIAAAPVAAVPAATAPAASTAPATVLNAEGKPVVVRRRNAGATPGSTPAAATPSTAPAAAPVAAAPENLVSPAAQVAPPTPAAQTPAADAAATPAAAPASDAPAKPVVVRRRNAASAPKKD